MGMGMVKQKMNGGGSERRWKDLANAGAKHEQALALAQIQFSPAPTDDLNNVATLNI
jgi:hypothetical protein